MAQIVLGFVSTRERRGAERKMLKSQREDFDYTGHQCWMHFNDRKQASEVVARLVEQGRTFDIVINK